MKRQYNLLVSDLASSTKLLRRIEEKYVVCRDVIGPFMMSWEAGKIIKKASGGDRMLRHESVNGFTHIKILCPEEMRNRVRTPHRPLLHSALKGLRK